MRALKLKQELHAALQEATNGSSRAAVIDRFLDALDALTFQEVDAGTPERTRGKITAFLDDLEQAHEKLGERLTQPAFAINVVGEAMARADLIHASVVELLKVGLYFFALDQIERRWSARAAVYTGIHADLLVSFLDRRGLKAMVARGQERMEEGRVYCLTYDYLNTLRKAYWEHCRASEDALDVALVGADEERLECAESAAPASLEDETETVGDRVHMMLSIFRDALTTQQQWIYLAKNRTALQKSENPPETLEEWLVAMRDGLTGSGMNWSDIAGRLGINEKTAKREYLRSLDILLRSSGEAVFGREWVPSGFVKRVLEQIRSIVREKDLRIRSSTGRGMKPLVQKWEVALRFVLNHERVSA